MEAGNSIFPPASLSDLDYDGANIVKSIHDSVSAGHPCITRTIVLVSCDFWWPVLSTVQTQCLTNVLHQLDFGNLMYNVDGHHPYPVQEIGPSKDDPNDQPSALIDTPASQN
ncbi:hypothetical protein PAXRUDRAFT_16875 [Paxillus rubicundulus Ve08.2h10]|uniref:Integrase zinc-binding domain-containing protein n=1 Tax=Paxillus rubicundulus Ve08.2h10 TaxID=930991 RepID=A0A0D0DJW9_9AGAM|nr:hypothetical protein PAXRUDRAFT_16875 [Paxillus rubicundulus Ve08.2h10]